MPPANSSPRRESAAVATSPPVVQASPSSCRRRARSSPRCGRPCATPGRRDRRPPRPRRLGRWVTASSGGQGARAGAPSRTTPPPAELVAEVSARVVRACAGVPVAPRREALPREVAAWRAHGRRVPRPVHVAAREAALMRDVDRSRATSAAAFEWAERHRVPWALVGRCGARRRRRHTSAVGRGAPRLREVTGDGREATHRPTTPSGGATTTALAVARRRARDPQAPWRAVRAGGDLRRGPAAASHGRRAPRERMGGHRGMIDLEGRPTARRARAGGGGAARGETASGSRSCSTEQAGRRAVLASALLDAEGAAGDPSDSASIMQPADFYARGTRRCGARSLAVHGRETRRRADGGSPAAGARPAQRGAAGPSTWAKATHRRDPDARPRNPARGSCSAATRRQALGLTPDRDSAPARGAPLGRSGEPGVQGARRCGGAGTGRVGDDVDAVLEAFRNMEAPTSGPDHTVDDHRRRSPRRGLWPGMRRGRPRHGRGEDAVGGADRWWRPRYQERQVLAPRARAVARRPVRRCSAPSPASGAASARHTRRSTNRRSLLNARGSGRFRSAGAASRSAAAPSTLSSRAWALAPSVVVLDYLRLCSTRNNGDPRQTVGRVSHVARTIARDLRGGAGAVLDGARQLRRPRQRPSRDPGDLVGLGKGVGEIEVRGGRRHRPGARQGPPRRRVLVVSKNRHGPLGRVELGWSGTDYHRASRRPAGRRCG